MNVDLDTLVLDPQKKIPEFSVGDTIRVTFKFLEEGIQKTQTFEGVVIAKRGRCVNATFTIRKISFGVGVERIFPLYAPNIESITVIKKATKVRRAKLYYLREKIGKEAKV